MAKSDEEGVEIVECQIVSNRLMEVMSKKGLSQEETSRRTRMMTGRQLTRILKNEHCPSLERAVALSTVLGEPLDRLFKFKVKTRKILPPAHGRPEE